MRQKENYEVPLMESIALSAEHAILQNSPGQAKASQVENANAVDASGW